MSNHTENGESIHIGWIILAIILMAFTFLVMDISARNAAGAEPVRFSKPCRVIAEDADHDTGKLDRIAARHGGVDYVGALAFPDRIGRWYLNDTGNVFGYSRAEDGRIYSTARCARIAPVYTR